jgi:hypothetical protein
VEHWSYHGKHHCFDRWYLYGNSNRFERMYSYDQCGDQQQYDSPCGVYHQQQWHFYIDLLNHIHQPDGYWRRELLVEHRSYHGKHHCFDRWYLYGNRNRFERMYSYGQCGDQQQYNRSNGQYHKQYGHLHIDLSCSNHQLVGQRQRYLPLEHRSYYG